jgi:hypothetical protein
MPVGLETAPTAVFAPGRVPGCTGRYSVIDTTIVNSVIIRPIIPLGSFRLNATVAARNREMVAG